MILNRLLPILSALLFLFLLPGRSSAGIYNYMEILIGDKGAGMGGAFTAVADDATATYYNPAGIVQIPFNSMSASANAITFKTRKGKFFIGQDEKLTSFDFIPNFWGVTSSTSIGKLGFSIVVPESDNFELHERYSGVDLPDITLDTARYDRTFETDTYLFGPSYALSILPGLSVGVSVYFLYNTFTENIYNFWDTTDILDDVEYSYILENSRNLNGTGTGLTGRIGLLYKINDSFRLSGVLRPATNVEEEVKVRQVAYVSYISTDKIGEDKVAKIFERGNAEGEVSYTRELPFAFTIGLAYLPTDRTTIDIDISYFSPTDYIEKTKILEDFKEREDSQVVILEEVTNGNVGLEFMLTPTIPLRTGLFTDFSSAPEVKDADRWQATHIDKYGMTLSSGYLKSNSTVIAGVKYSTGRGYGTAKDYNTDSIKREHYTQTDIAIFISGTYMF